MNKLLASTLVFAFLFLPSAASAASKPSVSVTLPSKSSSYDRTDKMPVSWAFKNVTKNMVVVTKIKLEKQDTKHPPVGVTSGSEYQHTVYAGQEVGGFVYDWALNDEIPGRYSIGAELRECNPKGCDQAPAGKLLSKKMKKVNFTIRNDAGWTSSASTDTTVRIISPNGGEEYVAGSGRNMTIKWEADNVPKGSQVCTLLQKQGTTGGGFVFPSGKFCKSVKDGKGSVTGKLIWTSGYDLSPGNYWANVSINAKAEKGGKDGATLAQDISDDTFELTSD